MDDAFVFMEIFDGADELDKVAAGRVFAKTSAHVDEIEKGLSAGQFDHAKIVGLILERAVEGGDVRMEEFSVNINFFENSFLVKEGLINPERFVPMFGMYGLAEAVNLLCEKEGIAARYGKEAAANEVGYRISAQLAEFVANTPVKYGWQKRAMLHAQSGISSDIGTTPGARLPYGDEPDPITHLQTVAPHHAYYYSGISDILTLDETIKRNPQALVQLCLGAFKAGMREFTANVSGNDLVRVTGYMVRLSDLEKYRAEGSRTNTTWLGEEAARNTRILERQPRVISHEQQMRFSQ